MVYARVVFRTNASAAESHDDINSARLWIDEERHARPESFRLGEIFERAPDWEVIATCDSEGWHLS
jgi:hypothetical protein